MKLKPNDNASAIFAHMLIAGIALFFNGLGVYLTIHASIGAGPWDVFNIGISKTFGILYGNASILVSFSILLIDVLIREPIGIAIFIDSIVVGKSVDFFNHIGIIPFPTNLPGSLMMMIIGLFIMGYTQYFYMSAALGCGPRDSLLVGLKRHTKKLPIGFISILLLSLATLIGYLLGGPVGVGTIICAFCSGPIMQFAFHTVKFDATKIKHQQLWDSFKAITK